MRKSTLHILPGVCLLFCPLLFPTIARIACSSLRSGYSSRVTMEVKSTQPAGPGGVPAGFDPHFVPDQVQILQSKAILFPVIDELGLDVKWSAGLPSKLSKEETYQKLLKASSVEPVRNTDMVVVTVTDPDRQEAADIANTIAVFYMKKRHDDQDMIMNQALQELKEEVDIQRQKVEAAKEEVTKIRMSDNIIDPSPDTMDANNMEQERKLLADEVKRAEAQQRVEELKTQLAKINKMSNDELLATLSQLGIQDATISDILPKYQAASAKKARLVASGIDHPDTKNLDAEMVVWKKQLDDALDAIRKDQQTRLDVAQASLDSEQKVYDTEKAVVYSHTMSDEYRAAKQNYLNTKKLLDAAEQKYEAEKMQLNITLVPAKIWDRAVPAKSPSSAGLPHIVAAATGFGYLCALFGAGLIFTGLRLRRQERGT